MTATAEQQEKTAAVWFTGLLALAFGGAGVLIAALAVGIERSWNGGAVEQDRAKQRRSGWLDNQRSWLDADHTQRTARAKQRKSWLDAGGDPKTKPAGPSLWTRLADGVRRGVANTAVAATDFAGGVRDGWKAANKARREGGKFRDVASTRPEVCATCRRVGMPVTEGELCADCAASARDKAPAVPATPRPGCRNCGRPGAIGYDGVCPGCSAPTSGSRPQTSSAQPQPVPTAPIPVRSPDVMSAAPAPVTTTAGRCGRCGGQTSRLRTTGQVFCPACDGVHRSTPSRDYCANCSQPGYRATVRPQQVAGAPTRQDWNVFIHEMTGTNACPSDERIKALDEFREEDKPGPDLHMQQWLNPSNRRPAPTNSTTKPKENNVTAPTQTQQKPTTSGSSATESNATILRAKLQDTKTTLTRIAELTDELAAERTKLDGQVRESDEFATATGQSSQARQALDESRALSTAMGDRLGEFSQGAISAEDQMAHAADGLRPAENAEDELRAAGADHRAVAPAGANA